MHNVHYAIPGWFNMVQNSASIHAKILLATVPFLEVFHPL